MSLVIGLTGGIGSGKSLVADMFSRLGAGIIDTDAISRQLTQANGRAIPSIRNEFGGDYITADGALDRAKMRKLAFSDEPARKRLETILHPLILEQVKRQLEDLRSCSYIVVVVPLLAENPAFLQLMQRVLVVDCTEEQQIDRVVRRNGMTPAETIAILSSQTSRADRLRIADDLVRNDRDLDYLTAQVALLHDRYIHAAKAI